MTEMSLTIFNEVRLLNNLLSKVNRKKFFLQRAVRGIAMSVFILFSGCDFNPLGGSKSQTGADFEPGKHTPSAPPVISTIADFTIDENDVQTIPFTINDPDTFMVCSFVFVKASSANNTIIDSTGLVVGGTYPNCTLTISPKAFKFGVVRITVDLYDFWTHATTAFNLNVVHILTPGVFSIIDAEGDDRQVTVTWQNAAYMSGTGAFTSPYYTLFYRVFGSGSAYTPIVRATSPYTVTGLTNGVAYDFYVNARNSIGNRNSNVVQATPTKFKLRGIEFISGSTQFQNTPGMAIGPQVVNASLLTNVESTDANYPTLNYAASENPVNGAFPSGTPKGSSITTPSGKYKVYVNSQGNILSGAEQ